MPKLTPEVLATTLREIKKTPEQTATYLFVRTPNDLYFKDGRRATPQDIQEFQNFLDEGEQPVDSGTIIVDTLINPNIFICGILMQETDRPDEAERTQTIAVIQSLLESLDDETNRLSVRGMQF